MEDSNYGTKEETYLIPRKCCNIPPKALKALKTALRGIFWLMSLLDCISDWRYYVSARTADQGLVYGRVEPSKVTAILAFSIIGSLFFIAEIVVFVIDLREIFRGTGYAGTDAYKDLLSAIITWFEDIPMFIIIIVILECREEAISVFQLTVASVTLLVTFISAGYTIFHHSRRQFKHWIVAIVRLIHLIGVFVVLRLAIEVFFRAQTETNGDFSVTFRKPSSVITASINDQKYFADVGVFLRDAGLTNTLKGDNRSDNWMHLFPIYELKEAKTISIKLTYSHANNADINMGIWLQAISANTKSWNLSECYNIKQDTSTITPQSTVICLDDAASGANIDAVYMDFRFQFPESNPFVKRLVFGKIYFNWKISTNGSCMSWDSFVSSVNDKHPDVSFLGYFRVNNSSSLYTNKYFYIDDGNGTRYFSGGMGDIVSVEEIWNTGWGNCHSTGSMSPVFDTHMNIECN